MTSPRTKARGLAFLDTNILVYQFDRNEPAKQKITQDLIAEQLKLEQVVISTQVVQEFMNVALRKFDTQMPALELEWVMRDLLMPICRHVPTADYYYRALDLNSRASLSFYDTLIIQAALDLGCTTLYSEDLQAGQVFGKLTVVNPFV